MSRKRKRSTIDELFGGSLFSDRELLPDDFHSTGYSVSVSRTPDGIKVKAKVGKDTDINAFRKQLQQKYPNAEIEIEGSKEKPLIREISTRSLKQTSEENNKTES